jgi:hypothetical protein
MSSTTTLERNAGSSPRRRTLIWAGGIAAVLIVAALAWFGYMTWRMSYIPPNLNFATTRLSEKGLFRATYAPRSGPISINEIHAWSLHLETPEGQPVAGAQITVDGGMPQHGHGLPTQPRVTRDLGHGDYLVEGMKFQMPGWWVVKFAVQSGEQADTTVFNLLLK